MKTFFRKVYNTIRGQDFHPFHIAYCLLNPKPKKISAFVRVHNEEEFLEASIRSIEKYVDEIVIVDNLSTDSSLQISRKLAEEYPEKIRLYEYPYEIEKWGSKNYSEFQKNPKSLHLISSFNTWCVNKCTYSYVLRWDGDQIALDYVQVMLKWFRRFPFQVVNVYGVNIHSDFKHFCARNTYSEPELFRKDYAKYLCIWYGELLRTPMMFLRLFFMKPVYMHMKYCKKDPFTHLSAEQKEQRKKDKEFCQGDLLTPEVEVTLKRWGIV